MPLSIDPVERQRSASMKNSVRICFHAILENGW